MSFGDFEDQREQWFKICASGMITVKSKGTPTLLLCVVDINKHYSSSMGMYYKNSGSTIKSWHSMHNSISIGRNSRSDLPAYK